MTTSLDLAFVDLTHTGQGVQANNTPLSVGFIAAAAKARFGDSVSIRLFKYPEALSDYLATTTPDLIAFSNYMWNENLHRFYASQIKTHSPDTITVFGGPNYPIDLDEQAEYLRGRTDIDFYVDGEGETPFVELLSALIDADMDASSFKATRVELDNIHYYDGDTFVAGPLQARIKILDEALPSPYLTGLMDEFLDETLSPIVQTSRGCPYSCAFCHDGISYMTKTKRFSQERIDEELRYIADRSTVPTLTVADLNWGMFPGDIDTAKLLAGFREDRGWPRFIASATAKNQKKRVIEMAEILGDAMHLGASIQSTDEGVLKNIKRSNIEISAIVQMAQLAEGNSSTFTEIILGLPGDTKEKHVKSVTDMLDTGIQDIRTFQFILLPGTEGANNDSRDSYEYVTRHRVLPRCFGEYTVYGNPEPIAEIHEICVANNTLSFDDYLECRRLNLSLSIFNNGNIFDDLFNVAGALGIARSEFIMRIHENAQAADGKIREIYEGFIEDELKNLWDDKDRLSDFVHNPKNIHRYLVGEYGSNQIFRFRAEAIFLALDEVVAVVSGTLKSLLKERGVLDADLSAFIGDYERLFLAEKSDLTDVDKQIDISSRFDFRSLESVKYHRDPRTLMTDDEVTFTIGHTEYQKEVKRNYFAGFGTDISGLTYFIHRNPARLLYREIVAVESVAVLDNAKSGATPEIVAAE